MMFDNSWSDAFAEYGIGAMAWETYNAGKPDEGERLCVIVPHPSPDPPYNGREWIHVYPMHAENNWAQPGPKNGWDGNREAPTFSPSIDCSCGGRRPGWHGYIRQGKVCDTNGNPLHDDHLS